LVRARNDRKKRKQRTKSDSLHCAFGPMYVD
jgi:hypothetical protein